MNSAESRKLLSTEYFATHIVYSAPLQWTHEFLLEPESQQLLHYRAEKIGFSGHNSVPVNSGRGDVLRIPVQVFEQSLARPTV